jgi:hypothetical protein
MDAQRSSLEDTLRQEMQTREARAFERGVRSALGCQTRGCPPHWMNSNSATFVARSSLNWTAHQDVDTEAEAEAEANNQEDCLPFQYEIRSSPERQEPRSVDQPARRATDSVGGNRFSGVPPSSYGFPGSFSTFNPNSNPITFTKRKAYKTPEPVSNRDPFTVWGSSLQPHSSGQESKKGKEEEKEEGPSYNKVTQQSLPRLSPPAARSLLPDLTVSALHDSMTPTPLPHAQVQKRTNTSTPPPTYVPHAVDVTSGAFSSLLPPHPSLPPPSAAAKPEMPISVSGVLSGHACAPASAPAIANHSHHGVSQQPIQLTNTQLERIHSRKLRALSIKKRRQQFDGDIPSKNMNKRRQHC